MYKNKQYRNRVLLYHFFSPLEIRDYMQLQIHWVFLPLRTTGQQQFYYLIIKQSSRTLKSIHWVWNCILITVAVLSILQNALIVSASNKNFQIFYRWQLLLFNLDCTHSHSLCTLKFSSSFEFFKTKEHAGFWKPQKSFKLIKNSKRRAKKNEHKNETTFSPVAISILWFRRKCAYMKHMFISFATLASHSCGQQQSFQTSASKPNYELSNLKTLQTF